MKINEVSRRYTKAIYETSKDHKVSEKVLSELRALSKTLSSDKTLTDFVQSPLIPPHQKAQFLKTALSGRVSDEVTYFMTTLAEKNRLGLFFEIETAFESIMDIDHGVLRGVVRSASALSPESRKKIEDTVNKVTGKKVILTFTEDPKLLGGMVAQVGGWTFDDSLESHLIRMGEELNRRAN